MSTGWIALAWGLIAGVGVLLIASPWLAPAGGSRRSVRASAVSAGGATGATGAPADATGATGATGAPADVTGATGVTVRPAVGLTVRERVAAFLQQAGFSSAHPDAFLAFTVLLGVAAGAVGVALSPVPMVGVVVGALAGLLPWTALLGRARRRRRVVREAWPDLVDHLVASIRAGQSLTDGIAELHTVAPPEVATAFADFSRDVHVHGRMGPALDALKRRLADPTADRLIETIRLAREVGGSELPTVLRTLSASLRLDQATRAEAEARQSWVLVAARLGVAAPWIVLVVLAARPDTAAAYNSPQGTLLLTVGALVTLGAYRIMRAIGRLPEERRWFA